MDQKSKPGDDQLVDEREAARVLGVAVGTLQVWRCTRRYPLAFVKIGRAVRYRRSTLEQFIESRTVSSEAA
jgi:excisionase family DNA binding protein